MDNDMLKDFFLEAEELFDEAEDSLLEIEKSDDYKSCYNSIFRAFHSVKGAAGMFGLEKLQEHMHFVENLLEKKKELVTMSPSMIDYLLNAVDSARKIMQGEDIEFEYFDPDSADEEQISNHKIDSEIKESIRKEATKRMKSKSGEGKVLIVDDEEDIVSLVKEFLTDQNYEIYTFTNANSALAEIKEIQPDLVITDIKMPEMNGIEFMGHVNKIFPHLPVIVVSGFVTKEVCLDAMSCGVSGVIEKPYEPEKLVGIVQVLVNRFKSMKLLKKSIDLLIYQFEDYDKYLSENCSELQRETFRKELTEILKQKKSLFENLIE